MTMVKDQTTFGVPTTRAGVTHLWLLVNLQPLLFQRACFGVVIRTARLAHVANILFVSFLFKMIDGIRVFTTNAFFLNLFHIP